MQDFNHVVLTGRLTRDAKLAYSPAGNAVLSFSIACNERKKHGEEWIDEVSFFDVLIFGKKAESINQYMVKGKAVAIDGKLHQDRWEKDGQNRSKIDIIGIDISFLGPAKSEESGVSTAPHAETKPVGKPAEDFGSDVPF
jgi:single-strand DNA-binding protein